MIEDVRRLRVEPGDVVVVMTRHMQTKELLLDLKESVNELFPDNDVLVLNGCDLAVARSVEFA